MFQGLGYLLILGSTLVLLIGFFQWLRARRLTSVPLGSTGAVMNQGRAACGPKGEISVQGNVVCPQPLYSPMTGQPCLYYSIRATATWKSGDRQKVDVLDDHQVAAQFAVDDGTGPVWIDARVGGDFEPSRFKSEEKGTGLLGGIVGKELQFGNYRLSTGILAMGTTYRVEERVLPIVPQLYACGTLGPQGGLIAKPGWGKLILSNRSRADLLSSATKYARFAFYGGGGAAFAGIVLAIVGAFVDPPLEPKTASESTGSASAAASVAAAPSEASSDEPPPASKAGAARTTSASLPKNDAGAKTTSLADAGASKGTASDAGASTPAATDAGAPKITDAGAPKTGPTSLDAGTPKPAPKADAGAKK